MPFALRGEIAVENYAVTEEKFGQSTGEGLFENINVFLFGNYERIVSLVTIDNVFRFLLGKGGHVIKQLF